MAAVNQFADDPRTADALIRVLEERRGVLCATCRAALWPHQTLMSVALGCKDSPRCLLCLADVLGQDPAGLRDRLFDYIRGRACFAEAWDWANQAEGWPEGTMPPTLQSMAVSPAPIGGDRTQIGERTRRPDDWVDDPSSVLPTDAEWDAGHLACGELVLELRRRLEAMLPGQLFKLCARDASASEDLPAWCRLTGHRLARAEPPNYWINRRE